MDRREIVAMGGCSGILFCPMILRLDEEVVRSNFDH
jgi:hypothetical protein